MDSDEKVKCVLVERHSCLTVIYGSETRIWSKMHYDVIANFSNKPAAWKRAMSLNTEHEHQYEVVLRDQWEAGKIVLLPPPEEYKPKIHPKGDEVKKSIAPVPKPHVTLPLNNRTKIVLDTLIQANGETEEIGVDDLVVLSGLPIHQVLAELLALECKKLVKKFPERRFMAVKSEQAALPAAPKAAAVNGTSKDVTLIDGMKL